jgi:hypothetical protein
MGERILTVAVLRTVPVHAVVHTGKQARTRTGDDEWDLLLDDAAVLAEGRGGVTLVYWPH